MGTCHEGVNQCKKLSMQLLIPSLLLLPLLSSFISAQTTDVPTPPYFTKQPKHLVLFQVSTQPDEQEKPFALDCEARGRPAPEYTWLKNGLVFKSDVYDSRINRYSGRGTLVFVSPAKNDEGLYQCNATNAHGTAMSNSVFVRQSELNSFETDTVQSKAVTEGDPFTMKCSPPSGFPPPTIFWIMQSRTGALRTINSSRITVDPDGYLHFSNVTLNDATDESMYACSANSMFRNEYKLGNRIMLNVIPSGSSVVVKREPAKQYESPPNMNAQRGESLRLSCIYSGTPLPVVTWIKKGGKLPPGRHMFENFGKTLRIKRVEFDDNGVYECRVSNGVGPIKSHAMSVRVQAKPYWLKVPDSINMAEDETVTFECEARGMPEPKLQWFMNGVPLAEVPYNSRRTIEGTKLILRNLKKSDTAVFQCNASNAHGYVHNNFYINVMSLPPQIIERPDTQTQAVVGSNAFLKCKADGAPVPKISWSRDGLNISGERFKNDRDGLTINKVQATDVGTYKCLARNKLGTDQASGVLIVKQRTALTVRPTDIEVPAGQAAIFRCSAKADESLPLEIIWLRNGQEIDFESTPRLIMTDDNSLQISKSVELDTGTYTCRAKTPLDSQEHSATLTVQDKPNRPLMIGIKCDRLFATLEWRPNGDNRASISNFIIQFNTSYTPDTWVSSYMDIPHSDTNFKVQMTPYANYSFRVIAQNKIGLSPPSEHSKICTTPQDRPYKNPDDVQGYGTTSTNLVIKWTPMPKIEHNGPGFKYKVHWKREDIPNSVYATSTVDWQKSSIVIPEQPTFKPYRIKVESLNTVGVPTVAATEVIGYSGEDVPLEAPKNFTSIRTIDAKTRIFTWEPVSPESLRGHFRGYKIQAWTEQDDDRNIREMTVQANLREARVNLLVPDAVNRVQIMAYNGAYNGPPSNVYEFRTPEGVPGAISQMDAFPIGATMFHVRWKKPNEPNGRLTGYRIYYSTVKGTSVGNQRQRKPITNPEQLSTRLAGLEPGTVYRISIRATTQIGEGAEYFIEVSTRSNVTGRPDQPDFKFAPMPEDAGKSVVRIEVIPGMKNGNPGSSFKVQYRRRGESQWAEVNFHPDEYWTTLSGLQPSTEYDIRVVASRGQYSTPSAIKTIEVGYGEAGHVFSVSSVQSQDEDGGIHQLAWLIGMLCAIALLLCCLFLVCLIKRNRGGKYSVHKKEAAQGRDLDYPEDGGFNEYNKPVDGVKGSRASLNSSVKNPESETDSMAEYGDGETGQFTEDGSFIGQYGTKNRKERSDQNATSPSALATFV